MMLKTAVAIVLMCTSAGAGQFVTGTVKSSTLQSTTVSQWMRDLGYRDADVFPLTIGATGCPFVDVDLDGAPASLMLDSGTARGFVITTRVRSASQRIEGRVEEANADGTPRAESFRIRADRLSVLGKTFEGATGTLSDWRMFSSVAFDGMVGLDFFLDRRLTLDDESKRVATTTGRLPDTLDATRYVVLDLVDPPKAQGHILYVRALVNGRDAIVYFDTGTNVTFLDPAFADGLERVERSGKFRVFRQGVRVELGGRTFLLDELREDRIPRGPGFDRPVALVIGSDILSHFIVTIDLRAKKAILARW